MSDPDKIDATMLKDLLASVKDLRSEVAALKSGATGGIIPPTGTTQGGDEPGQDAQLPHGSGTSDTNAPPAKRGKRTGKNLTKRRPTPATTRITPLRSPKRGQRSWRPHLRPN